MLKIRKYRKSDLKQIEALSPQIADELRDLPDVLLDTAAVCMDRRTKTQEDSKILGAAYLTAAPSFLFPEYGDGRRFVRANFQALPGTEQEIEVSEKLLLALQESLCALQEKDPEHRVILQLFSDAEKLAYTEFLMDCGFFPRHLMQAMERDLSEDIEKAWELPEGLCLSCKKDPDDFLFLEEHFALSAEAFGGIPDSTEGLRFRMRHGASVYAVTEGEKLIASVTVTPVDEDTAATEAIFCRKEYRRRHITAAMMTAVLRELRESGYRRARLTLFSDNLPAFSLYRKLGYELSENIIEFHYETNPVLRGY